MKIVHSSTKSLTYQHSVAGTLPKTLTDVHLRRYDLQQQPRAEVSVDAASGLSLDTESGSNFASTIGDVHSLPSPDHLTSTAARNRLRETDHGHHRTSIPQESHDRSVSFPQFVRPSVPAPQSDPPTNAHAESGTVAASSLSAALSGLDIRNRFEPPMMGEWLQLQGGDSLHDQRGGTSAAAPADMDVDNTELHFQGLPGWSSQAARSGLEALIESDGNMLEPILERSQLHSPRSASKNEERGGCSSGVVSPRSVGPEPTTAADSSIADLAAADSTTAIIASMDRCMLAAVATAALIRPAVVLPFPPMGGGGFGTPDEPASHVRSASLCTTCNLQTMNAT